MTRLTSPARLPNYAVIIRSIHQRGDDQTACLAELACRGLWLTTEQKRQAGLLDVDEDLELSGTPGRGTSVLGKQDLIDRARALSLATIGRAYEEATILAHRVVAYEQSDELGGPECLKLQQALVALREALGGDQEANQLQKEALEAYYF